MSLTGDELELCGRCGAPLDGDPDEDPAGGPDGEPSCGECERNRNFAADFETLDAADGTLDGSLDL